jgi:hypothetical protein
VPCVGISGISFGGSCAPEAAEVASSSAAQTGIDVRMRLREEGSERRKRDTPQQEEPLALNIIGN